MILLWFIPYYNGNWNYISLAFYAGAFLALAGHFYSIIKQARKERKEEAQFKEIESSKVISQTKTIPVEYVHEDLIEIENKRDK